MTQGGFGKLGEHRRRFCSSACILVGYKPSQQKSGQKPNQHKTGPPVYDMGLISIPFGLFGDDVESNFVLPVLPVVSFSGNPSFLSCRTRPAGLKPWTFLGFCGSGGQSGRVGGRVYATGKGRGGGAKLKHWGNRL